MVATYQTALVVFLLLAGMESGPTVARPAESPAGTFLAGVVVDEQGAPVAGAEIEIYPYRPGVGIEISEAVTASSGAGGTFRIEGLEPGTLYRRITWKHGFVPREDDHLDPSADPSAVRGTSRLVLRRGRAATGRIVDAAGKPVAGATVDLSQTSGYINWLHPGRSRLETRLRRTQTGASGAFTLPDLAPGGYELLIVRQGIAPQVFALDLPPGRGPWDFGRIEIGGAVLTGRVTDPSGHALAGASIWLRRESDRLDGGWGQAPATRTGDDGTFTISGLPPWDELGLDVCAAGFLPEELTLRAVPDEEVPIVLQPGGRITGRVVDPGGAPVAGAKLYTHRDGQSTGCEFNSRPCHWDEDATTSDAEGRFVLEPLFATTYTLSAHSPDLLPGEVGDVRIGPGETIEGLRIALERGEQLAGTVTGPDGKPVDGAAVTTVGRWWSQAVTGADGRYLLTAIRQGDWRLEIAAMGFETVVVEMEILPGENRLDMKLQADPSAPSDPRPVLREIRGQVVGLDERPIAGARVSAERAHTVTDAAGAFFLRVLADSSFSVSARKEGLASSSENVEAGDEPVEGLQLRLVPEAVLTGRVQGLEPWELASLRVGKAWGERFFGFAGLGKDGTWRLPHLAPGNHLIRAEAAGRWTAAEVTIAEGQREAVLDLHFPPVHEVRGWVMDAAGRPVPRAEVRFDRDLLNEREAATNSRADGSFTIRLEDGVYAVVVARRSLREDAEMQRVEVRGRPVDRVELVVVE